ncbi:ribose ABC transporter substrate-binding protein RbsB [Peribacillus frigoritolerans]|jgi:ribose transport system substrate-binding protein|uniref:ribose ABC transporter substrate-binding protein RbsB n=1 Tax=Peribacillus frigoritolerans TaxID=450367 RepID=UPI0006AC9923|nr:ribose ABC transporter substrate-binding protein RbsB [Peribacillus frigoritolerans]KOR81213.1 D-ribose transporter subunit RbsB [Bacillus sp. FJAT-21352]PCD07414.1 ribose ABC transporter substrate-binding protein RbsB [Peribacillus simplex]MCP1492311.1 ribose transport system substrate-binding protein [Peribacillus frigoritolerans]MCY9138588.1 ribose ABC transporter substrate-binding protein RbsB [Peribacillus frigoritolerans]MDF1999748.1 ribose ABC transporter substrate-binding protein Rb
MKKIVSIIMVLSLMVLAACSMDSGLTDDKKEKKDSMKDVKVGVSISTLNNPFFVSLKDGIEKEAKEKGMKVTVVDAQDDTAKQISGIEDLILQKVDVLLVNPTDSAAISSAVKDANDAGIPVITIDRSSDEGDIETFIASDNVAGGEMAAEYLVKELGEKAKVVELEGVSGASATRERGKGFHNIADKQLEVLTSQTAEFDRTKGLNVMENILQGNKDIQAVFAHNDEMALGAIEAIKAAGKDIIVVGFDGNDDALKAVENGELKATIAQQPALIGEEAVNAAEKILKGDKVDDTISVPLKLVTKE